MLTMFASPAERDGTMAHTYTFVIFHIVFSTKSRVFTISEPSKFWAYLIQS